MIYHNVQPTECSCYEINFGSVDEILTVSSSKQIPLDVTLPENLNESLQTDLHPTPVNEEEVAYSTSSGTDVLSTTQTSSVIEEKFATQSSSEKCISPPYSHSEVNNAISTSETEVKCATQTSSAIEVKFATSNSSENQVMTTTTTSSETEFKYTAQSYSDSEVKNATSSQTEVKFTTKTSSENEEKFANSTSSEEEVKNTSTNFSDTEFKCSTPAYSDSKVKNATSSKTEVRLIIPNSPDNEMKLTPSSIIPPSSENEKKLTSPSSSHVKFKLTTNPSETEVEFVTQDAQYPSKDRKCKKIGKEKTKEHPNNSAGTYRKKV